MVAGDGNVTVTVPDTGAITIKYSRFIVVGIVCVDVVMRLNVDNPHNVPVDMFIVPFIVVAVDAVPTVIVAPDISDAPIIMSPVV